MMKRALMALGAMVALTASSGLAGDVGFPEDFALAKDRSVPLKQLIPGTEAYYLYNCIQFQNTGQLDEVDKTLKLWIERYGRTGSVTEVENRQALLRYNQDPKASLELIRQRLGIQFNHQRELLGEKPKLPTALDPALISRDTLTKVALQRHPGTLQGFEDRALGWAMALDLTPDRRRHLLERLRRPDVAGLPKLIVDDLNYQNSRGFGSFEIHRLLLLAQLEELLKLKPDLLNETNFVNIYLAKLWPSPDVDWRHDPKAEEAYLDRLWAFVSRLNPAHNSLKACILYRRLEFDRSRGIYDKDRFMAYIQLPRNVGYMDRQYMLRDENRRYTANIQANFQSVMLIPPIRVDEPLVRSTLAHFFLTEDTYKPYAAYLDDNFLKHVFAETKILNGIGNMEQWYSMLPPALYQELKERVDLDFAYTNKELFGTDEKVGLDLHVKNVKTLIVKVYDIDEVNYYRANLREVDTAINLDGLVANEETIYTYDEPALRRAKRHFDFPALATRGVTIVEFIGNGISSRALIRKGKLRFLARTSVAGQVFTILDDANRKATDASIWLAGHEYKPDKDGLITVPFSNQPGRQAIVISQGDFASLDTVDLEAENYSLVAGIHVEREALLKDKKAFVVVRPQLSLNGTPVTLAVLEEPTLVITSTDGEGVSTAKEVKDFKLFDDRESTYEFQVPTNLASLRFTLKAQVQNLSQNKKIDLQVTKDFPLNGIDRTEKIEDLHLLHVDGTYDVSILGRTGEVRPDRPVQFVFKHEDFRDPVNVSLQTDENGRIALGALPEIEWFTAQGPGGVTHRWFPVKNEHDYPSAIQGKVGEALLVPYMGSAKQPDRSELSLLEKNASTFVADRFDALSLKDGFIQIQGLPAGDYDLLLKDTGTDVTVRLTQGAEVGGYVLSESRFLQVMDPKPLQIVSVAAAGETVKVQLANASKATRVHVAATRYMPDYPLYGDLAGIVYPEPYQVTVTPVESLYVVGRDIGDEYRYILERKYAKKYPGNLLTRPELLLNPWAIRKTETSQQEAQPGEAFDRLAQRSAGGRARAIREGGGKGEGKGLTEQGFSDLDFLSQAAVLLANLQPDADGVVTVKRSDLGDHQQIRVIACDPSDTVTRQLSLPAVPMKFSDLRLALGLDPTKHFTEQKQATIVRKGQPFVLADVATSTLEVYDTLGKVYALYATLSKNPTLAEFGFILQWPKLKPEEKREKYSKYACHELNFFLLKKDPDFFKTVILPYDRNKRDKTYLDRWLLADDVAGELRPWPFGQLNIVEQILLGQRIPGEAPRMSRHVQDLFDLLPPDITRENLLFDTAIRGSVLETGEALGFRKARQAVETLKRAEAGKELGDLQREAAATRAPGLAAATPAAPPPAPLLRPPAAKAQERLEKAAEEAPAEAEANELAFAERDLERRKAVRQFYRKLEKTMEYVENNYYHLPIEAQNAGLVTVNSFWNDYARSDGQGEFLSTHLAEPTHSFTEMMLALAVLDLPFEAPEHKTEVQGAKFTLTAGGSMVVFHKEIKPAQEAEEKVPVLVSQNLFSQADRYRFVNNERHDKYVSGEFLVFTVYGCHVVITNPTSSKQRLEILLQLPIGSIPVLGGQYTRSLHVDLEPYNTQTIDYYFYFPAPGDYAHYPVQVSKNEKLVAFAKPEALHVVAKPTKIDTTSWDYISQNGTEDQVLAYLGENNLDRTNLDRIAWRMRDAAFFGKVVALLAQRHVYNSTLWSYAILHNDAPALRQFLQFQDSFVSQCGPYIVSPILTIDPIIRKSYQHMEYWPLVNARTYQLGRTRKVLNEQFYAQYMRLTNVLAYVPQLTDDDLMSVTYYLLLQDRVEEALGCFDRVQPAKLATRLQYDYFQTYIDFTQDNTRRARAVASRYKDYPVDRWRDLFVNAVAQLDEIEGKAPVVTSKESREQAQTQLAATEPAFDFEVEAQKATLTYQNIAEARVNYYLMDIELLFSTNPFVQEYTGQFDYIRPNLTATVKLDPKKTTATFDLPERFRSSNVMIQIQAAGVQKAKAYYSNSLTVQLVENYGQLRVTHAQTGKPLPKVYVKVYARLQDGRVQFYKDGYTDLRGLGDYTSLSTNELDFVQRFSILVLSETDGAVVREAAPPKR